MPETSIFHKHLEWESLEFPSNAGNLRTVNNYYTIPENARLTVWRDEEYTLKGVLEGATDSKENLDYRDPDRKLQDGNLIKGETIIAEGAARYRLDGSFIGNTHFSFTDQAMLFTASIGLDDIAEIHSDAEASHLMEWFLTGDVKLLFPRGTKRFKTHNLVKLRDIDIRSSGSDKDLLWLAQSFKRDYFLIETSSIKCIVQQTDKSCLPGWANGVSIEYLQSFGIPDEQIRVAIAEIVGFVLGTQLLKVGSTELDSQGNVLRRKANNPYGNSVFAKSRKVALAPVRFTKTESIKVESVVNEVLPNYLKLKDKLLLSEVLWKYWTAKELPVGTNLPILSSALESLADKYLDHNDLQKSFSDNEKKEYKTKIADELKSLETKLANFALKDNVLNRLRNPFQISIGDKMRIFFKSLAFDIHGKSVENQALRSRNLMTHSSRQISDDDIPNEIKMTRAYETLFNRCFLKILGYGSKYIDFSTYGHPERELSENIEYEK